MNLIDAINLLKENNIKIYGTSLKSAISVTTVDKKSKLAFGLGNEANGVSEDVLNACDQNIIIPLDNNVESLNVGIAGAILMWELKK
jgi:TrmH family RNA methyltransferase